MRAFVLTVAEADVELAADALWSLGVVAVEERAAPAAGFVELWTSLGDDIDGESLGLPARWPWRTEEVDEAVADSWRAFAEPVWVEPDLVVCPAWVAFDAPPRVTSLTIEPGATFGLGDHPTTMLSLRAVRRWVTAGDRVLDVGCGSGVLSVAACLFGAREAVAIDIAPAAVTVTAANAAANGVSDQVHVSATALADVVGSFDLVAANILAPALVALAPDLRRVLAPGGVLLISGVLAATHDHVIEALAPLRVHGTETMNGWAAVTLRW